MNTTKVSNDQLDNVIFTLQYALETFEQTCQCGNCDPCTRGQADIREAIKTVEDVLFERKGIK
jgi:NADH:ubiquinone oxidoreductase subunit F (NADH-binding)